MLTIPVDNFNKGRGRLPLDEKLAQEFLDSLFLSKRWLNDPDFLTMKFQRFKKKAIELGRKAAAEGVHSPTEEDWRERVRTEQRKNPTHWTVGRLAVLVSKSRDEVTAALASA